MAVMFAERLVGTIVGKIHGLRFNGVGQRPKTNLESC